MKFLNKLLLVIIAIALVFSAIAFASAAGTTIYKEIEVTYSDITLYIDGHLVVPRDANGNRVEPFIYNGTTYLPVRAVGNALNKNVEWVGETSTVYLSDKTGIALPASDTYTAGKTGTETITVAYSGVSIYVNWTKITPTDANGNVVEPFIYNGTTYLPVRAVADAFNKSINWDGVNKAITLGHLCEGDLNVHFLDVGQADATFIELPNGETILIDAGTEENGAEIVSYIEAMGYDSITYLVATHPHADHIGGMAYVVDQLDIGMVYMTNATTTTQTYYELLTAIRNKSLTILTAKAGVSMINTGGLEVIMLAPNNNAYDDLNNYSAVVKITNDSNAFLFMGDAERESENEITSDLSADVLKVGHHGSNSSTGQTFLNEVSPEYAVISLGADNDYGHPAQTTLDKLNAAGVTIYRTDLDGTVVFTSDGTNISVDKDNTFDNSPVTTSGDVVISNVNKENELVTIKNNGAVDVDMTGWVLVSVTGNQRYTFPSYILEAGDTVTVASGDADGNLKWTSENVWNNSDSDPAQLYDSAGKLIATYN